MKRLLEGSSPLKMTKKGRKKRRRKKERKNENGGYKLSVTFGTERKTQNIYMTKNIIELMFALNAVFFTKKN